MSVFLFLKQSLKNMWLFSIEHCSSASLGSLAWTFKIPSLKECCFKEPRKKKRSFLLQFLYTAFNQKRTRLRRRHALACNGFKGAGSSWDTKSFKTALQSCKISFLLFLQWQERQIRNCPAARWEAFQAPGTVEKLLKKPGKIPCLEVFKQFQCLTLRYGHMSLPSPNSIRPNNPAGSTPEGVLRRKRQANWILTKRSKRETSRNYNRECCCWCLCILRINGVFRDLAITKKTITLQVESNSIYRRPKLWGLDTTEDCSGSPGQELESKASQSATGDDGSSSGQC